MQYLQICFEKIDYLVYFYEQNLISVLERKVYNPQPEEPGWHLYKIINRMLTRLNTFIGNTIPNIA